MITLPLHPAEAVQIGSSCFSVAALDGKIYYFSNLEVCDLHDEGDRGAMLLRAAKFAESGVRRKDLQEALGISRSTLKRAVNKLRSEGEASFHEPRRGRGASVMVGETAETANRLLASGMSGAAVARELGLSKATVNYGRRKGIIGNGPPDARREERPEPAAEAAEDGKAAEAPIDRGARDRRDREAPMGRGARDGAGRIAASAGGMDEARPVFEESLSAVARGGVLAALPMLLGEGLLDRAREFLSLPKGYYGLTSVLLLLSFLFMARVRNPEALRHQAPGEWGAVLGLDRCPEAKTLRRKIKALAANPQRVEDWRDALAEAWLAESPDACATLAVDGHVKVYTGRKGRLPKHFVSRQKLCLPASTSYWVNALGGKPLLCLNKDLDPTMTQALEQDVLPALERLGLPGPDAPNLLAAGEPAEPALTLVFDREGWSPALFGRLARRGIAVITWHKGSAGEPWPEAEFRAARVPVHGPGAVREAEVLLAERRIGLPGGPEVRQIRRLLEGGRQAALVTTDFRMPLEQVAGAMFSRWSQENFFEYMREEFNLDALLADEKLLLDIVRMIAYRAETRMMPAVADAQGKKQRPRRLLAELFQSEADIVPEPESRILRVRIIGTASNSGDAAIAGLLEELTETRTVFPGTGLRMVYELPAKAAKPNNGGPGKLAAVKPEVRTSELRKKYLESVASAGNESDLECIRVSALGKKGEINLLLRQLVDLDRDKRRQAGAELNELKNELASALSAKKAAFTDAALDEKLRTEWIDVTLPSRPARRGTIHPVSQVTEEVTAIFADLGFEVAEGPQIETDWYNFDALNMHPDHPARQEHDTFFLAREEGDESPPNVLRTHTSPVQIRAMRERGAPIRAIAPGRVYRCDYDQTHTPMFHQVEGLAIDRDVNMANLKWVLEEFCRAFFEVDKAELRFRASHFPFTEPSAEVDLRCSWNEGQLKVGEGDDWMEILGSGMVHPNVLEAGGIDASTWQGFAFGIGIDRIAMLKYGIPDLRNFFDSDLRWLRHFGFAPLDVPALHSGLSS